MDQSNGVVDRDQVHYHRYGVAPTLSLGIDTPTRLTFSYFKEEENNLPDYGIPFIDGAPAHVDRSNYYSLANYDRTRTNTDIGTIRFEQDFCDGVTLSDSLRYANYGFEYLVTGPFFGNDFVDSAAARHAVFGNRSFARSAEQRRHHESRRKPYRCDREIRCGGFANTLTGGLELSKEQSNVNRFQNGLDDIPPTPLLNPAPFYYPPTPLVIYANPKGRGSDVSVYALDSIAFGSNWDVDAGLRWDRFESSFSEAFTGTAFERTDIFVSPRVAVIYKPDAAQSYYLSYGMSQNPAIEYLIIAPSDESLSPEKNNTLELGGKIKLFDGAAQLTGALFDTRVYNARISDPDDPTVQQCAVRSAGEGHRARHQWLYHRYLGNDCKLHAPQRQDHEDQRSSLVGHERAEYASRCDQCLEHAATDPGLDPRGRLYRRQPSLRRYGKYRRRAGVRGVQRDDFVRG